MEQPPPVPPKDTPQLLKLEVDGNFNTPVSASKRKRDARFEDTSESQDVESERTPKRNRSSPLGDLDVSGGATPAQQRNLRRKKGVSNLSNLNLRHKANQQRQASTPRESKFQEGSLTDKPSEKPPSAFTRVIRTDSGNVMHVDELMSDYHDGMPTPRNSADGAVRNGYLFGSAEHLGEDRGEGSMFFRFGQRLAANFHPVTLWNKIWNETKEELTQRNIEEAERRMRQKREAEAKYAQMKLAGQLPTKRTSQANERVGGARDSGVVINEPSRLSYHSWQPSVDTADATSRPENDPTETVSKGSRTIKSRLHFKRPSLNNLFDLKRARSEVNLAASREASSSTSPTKIDGEGSVLRESHSKIDLKKQHKLSKRVSDLEVKLQLARRDLDDALAQASPMPMLGNKYERFTPVSTLKRSRFIPGQLPSLPSERLLDPAAMGLDDNKVSEGNEFQTATPFGASESHAMEWSDETVKASRARSYPARASSLFATDVAAVDKNNHHHHQDNNTDELADMDEHQDVHVDAMAGEIPVVVVTQDITAGGESGSLDTKLKDLDENVKLAKKQTRGKKRKSGEFDGTYKPKGDEEDDEGHQDDKATSKKRKSGGSLDGTVEKASRSKKTKGKKGRKGKAAVTDGGEEGPKTVHTGQKSIVAHQDNDKDTNGNGQVDNGAEDEMIAPVRTSLDSVAHSLEPVYEEEEETSTVPVNDAPSKPTAKATPARLGRGSRSVSPSKRMDTVVRGPEETMIMRAADAARGHPARRARSQERSKEEKFEWPEDVF